MAIWRKPLQFINVMLANRSPMSVTERDPGRMTFAKKIKPFAEHYLRVTLQRAGNKKPYGFIDGPFIPQVTQSKKSEYIESA